MTTTTVFVTRTLLRSRVCHSNCDSFDTTGGRPKKIHGLTLRMSPHVRAFSFAAAGAREGTDVAVYGMVLPTSCTSPVGRFLLLV